MRVLVNTKNGHPRQHGFILATVLVFLVVLSLVAFFAARLTRANTQVVNNLQNEKQAFFAAEAGIDEALYRLSLKSPSCVSMGIGPGIGSGCSGSTFDASIAPRIDVDPSAAFASLPARSDLGIILHYPVDTVNDPLSATQILLSTAVPSSSGNNLLTPSLQPTTVRIPYSTATVDPSPIDPTTGNITSTNLTIGWDKCLAANTSTGCDSVNNPYYPIRGLPVSSPRPVVKIASTGTVQRANGDVVASRKVTAWAIDCDIQGINGSILTVGQGCSQGIGIGGSATITTAGSIHVDAGASGGTCDNALSTQGSSTMTAGGDITSVGGASGSAASYTPDPKPGSSYVADPFNDPPNPVLYPPCFGSRTTNCDATNAVTQTRGPGSESAPQQYVINSAGTQLQPGIYYGGIDIKSDVTMHAGIYIMAGGGFTVETGTTIVDASAGVTIVNTVDPNCPVQNNNPNDPCRPGLAGQVSITGGNSGVSIFAPSSGPYANIAVFQDRTPTNRGGLPATQPQVFLQGGSPSNPLVNGIVYAPDASLLLQGNNTTTNIKGSLIVQSIATNGSPNLTIANPTTPENLCTGALYKRLAWQDF